jgi:hypothetical protein
MVSLSWKTNRQTGAGKSALCSPMPQVVLVVPFRIRGNMRYESPETNLVICICAFSMDRSCGEAQHALRIWPGAGGLELFRLQMGALLGHVQPELVNFVVHTGTGEGGVAVTVTWVASCLPDYTEPTQQSKENFNERNLSSPEQECKSGRRQRSTD